jgi:hypothetical protein
MEAEHACVAASRPPPVSERGGVRPWGRPVSSRPQSPAPAPRAPRVSRVHALAYSPPAARSGHEKGIKRASLGHGFYNHGVSQPPTSSALAPPEKHCFLRTAQPFPLSQERNVRNEPKLSSVLCSCLSAFVASWLRDRNEPTARSAPSVAICVHPRAFAVPTSINKQTHRAHPPQSPQKRPAYPYPQPPCPI